MEEQNSENYAPHHFSLDNFIAAKNKMIATNKDSYSLGNVSSYFQERCSNYTPEEILDIVNHGSLAEKQKLSWDYFNKNGYYKRIILYYATLLKYAGVLIPNPAPGKSLATPHISKRYYSAIDFLEKINLSEFFVNCAYKSLVSGCYYGIRASTDEALAVIDLPEKYCTSRFKDLQGNDLIQFDLGYFDNITDEEQKKIALNTFPKIIAKAYASYNQGKGPRYFLIPSEYGICFPFINAQPFFLEIIPQIMQYEKSVILEEVRNQEDVHKIVVQKIPHLADGRLLFEPDEAEEIHNGTVGMLKGDKNISVLTTYADVDVVSSNGAVDNVSDNLSRMEQNIYSSSGVSRELFAATGSSALGASVNNDISLMMYLANKFALFVTNMINSKFSNSNISFKYSILDVSYYNEKDFIDRSFKLVNSGYSFLIPSIAAGLTQRDLCDLKELENDVLKLNEKLIPLATAYTQSANSGTSSQSKAESSAENGRPSKDDLEKSEQTVANQEAMDNN